jgi:cobalamin biosynthesis protein CbiD
MERGGEVRRPTAGTRDSRGMHGRAHVRRFGGDEPDGGGGAIWARAQVTDGVRLRKHSSNRRRI